PTGAHTLSVHAYDRVGFQATTNATTTVYYDGTPPGTPTITSTSPAGWTNQDSFGFSWTNPGDVGSGIANYQFLLDGAAGPYDVGNVISVAGVVVGAGAHTVQVRAIDAV